MTEQHVRYRKRVLRRQYSAANSTNSYSDRNSMETNIKMGTIVRKKPDGLICSICDGPAHGYNFDAITCESCKAFFRRNALKTDGKFKCRANDGQCLITITTRKRCKACRLSKCFAKGMRADGILTDEERINKKLKIEENRRLRRMLYPDSSSDAEIPDIASIQPVTKIEPKIIIPMVLSAVDSAKIEQIRQAYQDSIRLTSLPSEVPVYPYSARLNAAWDMINLPCNLHATRSITYFKLLPEFARLNENDKLLLVKFNSFTMAHVRGAMNYDVKTDSYHERGSDDCVFQGKDLIQCYSYDQYVKSTRCVCRLLEAAQNDRFILQILLLLILFSKGSFICTYDENSEPIAQDSLTIYHTQNIFAKLLWNYIEVTYGSVKSIEIWIKLMSATMETHLQAFNTLNTYIKKDNVADHLVPLMKSVMLIS